MLLISYRAWDPGFQRQRYYQEEFFRFCRHYGTVPDGGPARHTHRQGADGAGHRLRKGNCVGGRNVGSLEEAPAHLLRWREEVANVRIHGTTRLYKCYRS